MSTQQPAPATQQAGATKEHLRIVRVIADKIEDGTLFRSGIYSNKDLARFVRNVADAAAHQPAPATQQPEGDVVAYLDVGVGGYLDLGSDLSEDALQQLPKGRHALVIAGAYGIDGYVAAPQPSPTAQAAPAATDFTTLDAAMRAIQQAIGLIGEPADERMQTIKRVLRGAVIVAEDSGEMAAPAAGAVAGPWKDHQTREIVNQLRDCAREFHATQQLRERLLYVLGPMIDWMRAVQAPTPAAQADSVLEDAARESEYRRGYRHGYEQRDAEVRGAMA